jgi:hypothetical protein
METANRAMGVSLSGANGTPWPSKMRMKHLRTVQEGVCGGANSVKQGLQTLQFMRNEMGFRMSRMQTLWRRRKISQGDFKNVRIVMRLHFRILKSMLKNRIGGSPRLKTEEDAVLLRQKVAERNVAFPKSVSPRLKWMLKGMRRQLSIVKSTLAIMRTTLSEMKFRLPRMKSMLTRMKSSQHQKCVTGGGMGASVFFNPFSSLLYA